MGIKTFWYLTQADGDYPWTPGGLYPVDGQRRIELAKTIDDGGFDAVDLSLTVDGEALNDAALEAYRAKTGTFTLPLAPVNFWEVAFGVELGSSISFASDAIGVIVSPLSVGTHTIVVSAESEEFGFTGTLTYVITVAPQRT